MELARCGYGVRLSIVPVIGVLRDEDGRLVDVFSPGAGVAGALIESVMQFEVDRVLSSARLEALVRGIQRILSDVRAAVEDWAPMRRRMQEIVAEYETTTLPLQRSEVEELTAFLEWVVGGNFIFLGSGEYDLIWEAGEDSLHAVEGSGLGVFRHRSTVSSRSFAGFRPRSERWLACASR